MHFQSAPHHRLTRHTAENGTSTTAVTVDCTEARHCARSVRAARTGRIDLGRHQIPPGAGDAAGLRARAVERSVGPFTRVEVCQTSTSHWGIVFARPSRGANRSDCRATTAALPPSTTTHPSWYPSRCWRMTAAALQQAEELRDLLQRATGLPLEIESAVLPKGRREYT